MKGENIRESIPGVPCFRTDEPEVKCCRFDRLGGVADERVAFPGSSRRSEQLSCTKFFHPSYGLFNINFQSLVSF